MTPVQTVLESLGLAVPDPRPWSCPCNTPRQRGQRFVDYQKRDGLLDGRVYFAQALPGGPIKIGWAMNVQRRLRELRHVHCPPYYPIATIEGTRRDERRLHAALDESLADMWREREWFRPTPDVLRVVRACGGEPLGDPLPDALLREREYLSRHDASIVWYRGKEAEMLAVWMQNYGPREAA